MTMTDCFEIGVLASVTWHVPDHARCLITMKPVLKRRGKRVGIQMRVDSSAPPSLS